MKVVKVDSSAQSTTQQKTQEQKELMKEQHDELEAADMRKVRQDIVLRFWGSESELTKEAYADLMRDSENKSVIVDNHSDIANMKELKDNIVRLKLSSRSDEDDQLLQELVGSLANAVNMRKESLVLGKMNEMVQAASDEIGKNNHSVNASVTKD